MTLLEYITDLQSQGLSGEEIFAKAQEFKGRTKPEEVVEEVKTDVVTGKTGAAVTTKPENASEGMFSQSIYGNGQSQYQEGSFSEEKIENKYKPGDFDEVFKNVFGTSIEESNVKEKKYKQEQINDILSNYKIGSDDRTKAYFQLGLKPDDTINSDLFENIKNQDNRTKEETLEDLNKGDIYNTGLPPVDFAAIGRALGNDQQAKEAAAVTFDNLNNVETYIEELKKEKEISPEKFTKISQNPLLDDSMVVISQVIGSADNIALGWQNAYEASKGMGVDFLSPVLEKVIEEDKLDEYILNQFEKSINLTSKRNDIGSLIKKFDRSDIKSTEFTSGVEFIGGIINAVSSLGETIVPAMLTSGYSLLPQIAAPMYVDYNVTKANNLYGDYENPLEKLRENDETEILIPAGLGALSMGLEYVGLKGIGKFIAGKTGAFGPLVSMGLTQNKEGLTEVGQVGIESFNNSIAKGISFREATNIAFDKMTSREGIESYAMGFVASGGITAPSAFSKMMVTEGQNRGKVQGYINTLGELQVQRNSNNDPAFRKSMDIQIESVENSFKDFINNSYNLSKALNKEQQGEILSLIDKKSTNNKTLKDLTSSYKKGKMSGQQYGSAKGALINSNKALNDKIIRVQSEANLEIIEKETKKIADIAGKENVISLDKKQFTEEAKKRNIEDAENAGEADAMYFESDGKIYINKERAAEVGALAAPRHELFHKVTDSLFNDPAKGEALVDRFLETLSSKERALVEKRINENYKFDSQGNERPRSEYLKEYFTSYSDLITNDQVNFTDNLGENLLRFGKSLIPFWKSKGFINAEISSGRDVYNWIKDYNKSMKAGKGLDVKSAELIKQPVISSDDVSMSKTASNKVQEIYDAKGKDGAFEIIQQYEGMANKIANKYQDVPGFDRQLLVDEILTGKRGVIDMINEYNPSTNVPVAAYINKYLRSRSIEAANRILKQDFETDVTEAKSVVAEETKQPEVVSRKVKKPSETIAFDKATESKIDEAVSKNFKGDEVKFSDTRNVPKDIANIYGEKLGLNPQTITDKTRNYSKKDAEGLTRAKQFLLKNAKDDYARLPKLKDDFGKGTFVPKNVKDALYTDGKLTGSLKDYMDLIREKPIKPIYRDRVGQTIRGLLNLAIRNRMLETAQPSQAKRLQSGALFSKTITPKQNTELLEVAQLGGIDNLANYLKDKGLLKDDITATKSNRKARQASILESVKNGKIPFKLVKLLKLNNFGRETVYGNKTKKYDSRAKAENAGITDVKKYFTTTSGEFIEANGKKPSANTRTDWNPSRGSLYYGATDPAYNDMITAAKANDNLYPNSEFEKVKRIVIPRNKKLTRKDKKANKIQEEINQKALADFVKILDKRDGVEFLENGKTNPNYGKLIIPLNDSALFISQAYQGTTGLIKISAPFVGVSNVFVKAPKGTKQAKRDLDYIEEHSPPASKVGLSIIYGLATNTVAPIMKGVKDNFVQIQLSNSSDVLLDIAKLDKRFADGTSIVTPNAGFLRLAAAGINLNTIEDLNTGSDIATTMGYPLKGKFKKDPSAVNIQNKLMLEQATNPDMKFSKSVGRLNTYVKSLGEGVIQASNKNSGAFGDKVNTDMSMESQVKTLGNYDKTLKFSRSLNTKPKGISVFDFDDTLAKTKEKVIVNKTDGTTIEISAAKFAEQASELQENGATFNFDNFKNVGKGTQKGPLADLALRRQGKFGSKDIFVLTARPQIAASDIKMFLDGIGLNLPIENITGLEDGSPQAKANWVISKTAEGYNDFYFADDAIKNVKAVAEILDQVDVKSKVQIAKFSKTKTFDKIINNILEDSTGIKPEAEFSRARAQTVGAGKGKFTFFTTPSAEDFVGLIYKFLGKGKVGNAQFKFFQDNLIDPYNRAEQAVTRAKITAANDFKALKNSLKTLPKSLSKKTGIGGFTFGQAARVAVWTRQGMEVPGLSKRDAKELNAFIDNNAELDVFVDELINIQKGKPYPKPSQTWLAGNITSDIVNEINKVNRKEYMQEFNENIDIIFSDKVMNKLEAAYGPKYVEALRDIIRRMKSGSNRPVGNSRIVDGLLNWLNNSVGAIMFLNTRSAVLQTISAVNFINFGNNNLLAAGKAFANQKQYWKDFMTLFNSPYLVERRDGLKINVSESEIADAVSESSNKPKAFLNLLLSKGFVLTRFADSFAIAAGGSTFYRNQVAAYVKGGMDQKAAEKQAFDDFYAIAEESQQSSNPSKISQQQASGAGRVILAFANTPMQYARIIKRSSQDLVNGRGDWKTNVSKIVYYGAMQNLIFNALSNALFALAFDEEDEEQEDKTGRIANGMADSLLRGLGIRGAAVSAVKDALITVYEEENKEKGAPELRKAITDLFGFSPPLDSKIRKLTSGLNTLSWEREKMNQEGFNLNNPAYLAFAQVISGLTNVPLDRAITKINNLRAVTSDSSDKWQKVALLMGWSAWDLGLPYYGVEDKVEMTPQMILKEKVNKMKKETSTKQQKETLLKLGLTKQQIKALKYEETRVKKIIELQEKKDDSKN